MGLVVTVAPTQEPCSLQDIKDHCRIEDSVSDATLRSYVVAARRYIERAINRTLPLTTYRLSLTEWADEIRLPMPPLVSVASIAYTDAAGNTQTLDPSVYFVDTTTAHGRIVLQPRKSWPTLGEAVYPIAITFVAGYANADMPEEARQVIRLLVAHLNENREAVSSMRMHTLPMAVDSFLSVLDTGRYL